VIERGNLERAVWRTQARVEPIEIGTLTRRQSAVACAVGELEAAVVQTVDRQLRREGKTCFAK